MELVTDGPYPRLQCWINHEARGNLVKEFMQNDDPMPAALHQHVEMLRVCVAISTLANVQVHAKVSNHT